MKKELFSSRAKAEAYAKANSGTYHRAHRGGYVVVWEIKDATTPALCGSGNPEAGDYAGTVATVQEGDKAGRN